MTTSKPSNKSLFTDPTNPKRLRRAENLRKRALSPVRILLMILMLPVTTAGIAIGVYLRTSEFEREEAALHLIALAGCDAVLRLAPGPFLEGQPGYHPRNDPDGDGVACDVYLPVPVQAAPVQQTEPQGLRAVGNAKFVRP